MTRKDLLSRVGDGAALEEAQLLMYPSGSSQERIERGSQSPCATSKPTANGPPSHTRPTANPLGEWQHMLKSLIVGIVDLCTQHPWWLIGPAAVLAAGSGVYAGTHFAIRTDTKIDRKSVV